MNIEKIRSLSPLTINRVVETQGRDTCSLPAEDIQYILQLNRASELMRDHEQVDGSQLSVARALQREFPALSLRTARRRVADCISYLYSDSSNTPEEWHEFYADKMDMLAQIAEQNGNIESARRCYQQAHDYRELAAAGRVAPERVRFKRILVSPDVDASRMGLGGEGIRDLLRRANKIIDESNIPQKEKERLRRETELETGIEDVSFEE